MMHYKYVQMMSIKVNHKGLKQNCNKSNVPEIYILLATVAVAHIDLNYVQLFLGCGIFHLSSISKPVSINPIQTISKLHSQSIYKYFYLRN